MPQRRFRAAEQTVKTTGQRLVDYIVARPGGPNGGSSDTWQSLAARATKLARTNVTARDLIDENVGAGADPIEINVWLAASGGALSNDGVNYTFAAGQALKLPAGILVPDEGDAGLSLPETAALTAPGQDFFSTLPPAVYVGGGFILLALLFGLPFATGSSKRKRRKASFSGFGSGGGNTSDKKKLAIAGGAAALAYLIISGKGRELVGDVQNTLGLIPSAAKDYADVVTRVAQESGWPATVLFAVGWRESKWGSATALDVTGPTGTGDFMARTGHWLSTPGALVIRNLAELDVQLPDLAASARSKWKLPSGQTGPYAVPADGKGWGRGLMQIDYGNSLAIDWTDPYQNLSAAAALLLQKKAYLASRVPDLAPADLLAATIAAYNHGEGAVADNLENGRSVDFGTTKGNYSSDVLASAVKWGLTLAEGVA